MGKKVNIIGGGLAGAVIASQIPSVVYEREAVGGLCKDNKNYQDFVHIFHTDDKRAYDFVSKYFRPHKYFVYSYHEGKYYQMPQIKDELIIGYSLKMWGNVPENAIKRLKETRGSYFNDKYQGILNATAMFKELLRDTKVIKRNIKDGDLPGDIILTGAVDEYFNYCYGELPYVGMKSCHCQSKTRLPADAINYPDIEIPFVRTVDYSRLGFENGYIGIEFPSNDKHYPVVNDESSEMYQKYKNLADKKGVILAGRLGRFEYMDMDDVILSSLEIADDYRNRS